jgi:nicotinate-nucleotide pyrophosphorylase (carboxylating)
MAAHPRPPEQKHIREDVRLALLEDIGSGDCTAGLIPAESRLQMRVVVREPAVISGRPWFEETFIQLDEDIALRWSAEDGEQVVEDQEIVRLEGPARALLSGERTALNFLQTLSGTATRTRRYVDAVKGAGAKILDTRKTLPGLRLAQKYAVLCGGGCNHRIGLFDAILIKENHISAAGSISYAVEQAKRNHAGLLLEVEVETLGQLEEACRAGADRVLLDNFPLSDLRSAVAGYKGKIELEASGGIELDTIGEIAASGVDFISVGDITKSVDAIDFSMRFV